MKRFNAEHGTALEAFPLAAYSSLMMITQQYPDVPATAAFDRVEKIDDKLRKARAYADSDPKVYPNSFLDAVTSHPIPKGATSREIRHFRRQISWRRNTGKSYLE